MTYFVQILICGYKCLVALFAQFANTKRVRRYRTRSKTLANCLSQRLAICCRYASVRAVVLAVFLANSTAAFAINPVYVLCKTLVQHLGSVARGDRLDIQRIDGQLKELLLAVKKRPSIDEQRTIDNQNDFRSIGLSLRSMAVAEQDRRAVAKLLRIALEYDCLRDRRELKKLDLNFFSAKTVRSSDHDYFQEGISDAGDHSNHSRHSKSQEDDVLEYSIYIGLAITLALGFLFVRDLFEKRSARRLACDVASVLLVDGTLHTVRIIDVSKSGAKLMLPEELPETDAGQLLVNDKFVWVRVRWSNGSHIGVSFNVELEERRVREIVKNRSTSALPISFGSIARLR